MSTARSFRYWLLAFVLAALAVPLSIVWVDRPVADFVHDNLLQRDLVQGIASLLGPLVIFVALALAFLFAAGAWLLAGRELPSWTKLPLLGSWSAVWALALSTVFKRGLGRADPEMWAGATAAGGHPGIYGFHLLRGGPGYESFPSGTTAIAAAIIAVLWLLAPRLRAAGVILLVFVAAALVVTNGHFVSDVIAGGFLGISIGWMTIRLMHSQAG